MPGTSDVVLGSTRSAGAADRSPPLLRRCRLRVAAAVTAHLHLFYSLYLDFTSASPMSFLRRQIMMMGSKETALLFYPKCFSLHNLPPTAGLQNAAGVVRTAALDRPLLPHMQTCRRALSPANYTRYTCGLYAKYMRSTGDL